MVIFLFEALLLVVAIGLALWWDVDLTGSMAFTPEAAGLGIAAAVLPNLILAPAALKSNAAWITDLRDRTARMMRRVFGEQPGLTAALAVSFGGIAEEVLFRGVLIPALDRFMPVWLAVVVVGAGFGLLHPVTRSYVALAALLGIFWGALFVWTGNLVVPMIAHALNNVIALAFYMRLPAR